MPLTRFLFWNTQQRDLSTRVAALVAQELIDVVVLAECPNPTPVLNAIRSSGIVFYHSPGLNPNGKVEVFTAFAAEYSRPVAEGPRYTIRRLNPPGSGEILLAGIHLHSKLNANAESQAAYSMEVVQEIEAAEVAGKLDRTLVLGDLNMNPFDPGVVSAMGFHATKSPQIARRGHRVINGRARRFFYNPMWLLYGKQDRAPPGTFYRSLSEPVGFHWNMFDQVLLRPSLLSSFLEPELSIVTGVGDESLLTKKRQSPRVSDHLPLKFALYL